MQELICFSAFYINIVLYSLRLQGGLLRALAPPPPPKSTTKFIYLKYFMFYENCESFNMHVKAFTVFIKHKTFHIYEHEDGLTVWMGIANTNILTDYV